MTDSEKEKITSAVQPLYVRECEDSISVYFLGMRPYRENRLSEISVTILRHEEGNYWIIGHDVMGHATEESRADPDTIRRNDRQARSKDKWQNNANSHRKRGKHGKNRKKNRKGGDKRDEWPDCI